MKKFFTIAASIVATVMLSTNATAQITGVELARKQQGTAFQTNENVLKFCHNRKKKKYQNCKKIIKKLFLSVME